MEEGIQETDNRAQKMAEEQANMPNFNALANLHGSLSNMGKMRKRKHINDLASKLGVQVQQGDEELSPEELMNSMIQRAQEAGKSEQEINEALQE
jgi:hypothetical protein